MVTVELKYKISKTKKLELTTEEYCKYHGDRTELKNQLAKENNVDIDNIYFTNDMKIIDGELDYDNLNK